MDAYLEEIPSPVGPMVSATSENGALLSLWFREGRRAASFENALKREGFTLARDKTPTSAARDQLLEYFAGGRRSFDIEVARRGSEFEEAVWRELSRIPFGETRTYGQVAEAIGDSVGVGGSGSAVEVGRACAANPVLLVVPCHRVLSADGSLRGYAAGLPIKARLLDFEEASQRRLYGYSRSDGGVLRWSISAHAASIRPPGACGFSCLPAFASGG